ncbi:hypothetical protein [Bordetella genomosp. 10]|uniref:hypothetical protein n=1 Tax=Bordetella genomosp. 10 TaxID=1416804 RepID=UPI0015C61A53|nr:hypothetical protein [Bordetella genomosp. 10]
MLAAYPAIHAMPGQPDLLPAILQDITAWLDRRLSPGPRFPLAHDNIPMKA